MPEDLQIIDGFERLRTLFTEANPGYVFRDPAAEPKPDPELIVTGAWVSAMMSGSGRVSISKRRIRSIAHQMIRDSESATLEADVRALSSHRQPLREGLIEARKSNLWPFGHPNGKTQFEAEKQWKKLLPGLKGMKSWRFMRDLGCPVMIPVHAVRRFLWRFGLVESGRDPGIKGGEIQTLAERLSILTGTTVQQLEVMLLWHTGNIAGLEDGGTCGREPKCSPDCPFYNGCLWARFRSPDTDSKNQQGKRTTNPAVEKKIAAGDLEQLADIELLSILAAGVGGSVPAAELAENLINRFHDLCGLGKATLDELKGIHGFSTRRAMLLIAALELGRRAAAPGMRTGDPFGGSHDVWNAFKARFSHLSQEYFVVILLDVRNRVIDDHIISRGTLTGSMAHPREVFKPAIQQSAASIILLHNHPSGDPEPSPDDRRATHRLKEAGEILGIRVLDHIILGRDKYYSFTDESA
jgi:DNA repair protein RadC